MGASQNGRLFVWDLETGDLLRDFDAHYKKISCLRVSEDGQFLIAGSLDANITIWKFVE